MSMFQLPKPAAMREALGRRKQDRTVRGQDFQFPLPCMPPTTPPTPDCREPAHIREVAKGVGKDELAVLPVQALPLADAAQVVVWAHTALIASSHHRPVATITNHIGVHHVSGCLLSTWWAMFPPALLLLCRESQRVHPEFSC